MAGIIRLSNTGTGNGQSTITTAASGDTTYTLPSGGGTFVTTSSTQALTVPFASGTVSAPSVTFLGDSNTGIYSPAADTIAFTEGGVESLRIDSSGRVGIGTSSPSANLHVAAAVSDPVLFSNTSGSAYNTAVWQNNNNLKMAVGIGGGSVGGGLSDVAYIGPISNIPLNIQTNNTARISVTAAGNVGIGTTSPSLGLLEVSSNNGVTLAIKNTSPTVIGNEFCQLTFNSTSNSSANFESAKIKAISTNGGANLAHLTFENSGSERARIDSSGRFLVGTSSARSFNTHNGSIQLSGTDYSGATISITNNENSGNAAYLFFAKQRSGSVGGSTIVQNNDKIGELRFLAADGTDVESICAQIDAEIDGTPGNNDTPGRLVFSTTADGASSPTERMRITNAGSHLFNTTNDALRDATSGGGVVLGAGGRSEFARDSSTPVSINRTVNDGTLIDFRQDATIEGTISVSGTTVSYNGAHLSRWSQLPSGAERTEILRGSVLSNIDEMCEWGEEGNEQLNRMKVSDVEGDKNVSGVFQAWDDDDSTYVNDFYCAMTGDFIIRIGAGVTVERGDLLMSAGDGTAKPQDDDIIRSKTIAKVTSTNVSCTYDDGSYCVPCVLMAC